MEENEVKNEKKAFYEQWWFWLIVVLIIIIGIIIKVIYGTGTLETELNKEIVEEKLTYYVSDKWKNKEDISETDSYKYYYPSEDSMIMVIISEGDDYGNDESIDIALDGYISGLDLDDEDFISKDVKEINGNTYGIVRNYMYSNDTKYETISYFTSNENEAYVFLFGQKYKMNNKFINLVEDMISKTNIIKETEKEKQARLEQERLEQEQKEAEEKRKQEEETARKQQEESEFKASCQTYTFEQMARNPENFKGTNVKVTGEVVQALYGTSSVDLRINITKEGTYTTYYTDTIYVTYYPEEGEDKILEEDIITVYGTSQGDYTYTSTLGTPVTLPLIYGKYIEIN